MPETHQSADSNVEQLPLFLLIDGHSLAFRSYYAFAMSRQGPLRTATGIPTSVCFGFLNSLFQVLQSEKPKSLAVAFDRKEATFRHEADVHYKSRQKRDPRRLYSRFSQPPRIANGSKPANRYGNWL